MESPISQQQPITAVSEPLPISEIGKLLIKHYGLSEGLFDILVEFGVGFGAVGPRPEEIVPGVMIGVSKIGLINVEQKGPSTLNAAEINPPRKTKKK
jgi:hypothetical protein